jgi:predicted RNase H-like HicB family nuclease
MKRTFTASVWQESNSFVAQCLEIDIASQGETQTEALANLEEALSLHFEPLVATIIPQIKTLQVEIDAA